MKKSLLLLILFFSMFSCKDSMESVEQLGVGTDGRVNANITLVLPDVLPAGRALTEQPYVENLYLAIFDAAGYLLEYVKAEATPAANNETEYSYKVSLSPTSYPTTIHFIGNAPSSVSFGSETEVLGKMYTYGGNDAYWQKVHLSGGIKLNAEGTALDAEVQESLKGIRLIRNFSWIELKLDETVKNFQLESYCVVNSRDKGSVAPYNTSKGEFADYNELVTHMELVEDGYGANVPVEAALDKQIPHEMYWCKIGEGLTSAYFIYEREMPQTDPLYILMKGTYDPNTEAEGDEMTARYYKVDLRDSEGDYFPVLRNFKYSVQLTNISHSGHASAQAAAQGLGSGDVTTSIETESFNNISNNIARIFVSYTDTTLVNSDVITLKYKFIGLNPETDLNGNVTVSEEGVEDGQKVIKSHTVATTNDADSWRTITITPEASSNMRKTQSMTLTGTVTSEGKTYTLQRKVKFTLIEKMQLQLVCDPDAIAETIGTPFDLVIKVPGGLGYAMFPLDFELEAENQSITPDLGDDLPVVTGTSIVPEKTSTTIGFIKSLSWDEYESAANVGGYKSIRCHFKSNKAKSDTEIYALNKYFEIAGTELTTYVPSVFSNLAFNPTVIPATEGTKVTFSFIMSSLPAQGNVTVTLDGLEPDVTESQLTYIGVKDGKAQYSFAPTQLNHTLALVTAVASGTVNVKLEAYRFIPNNATAAIGLLIPAGNINVGSNSNINGNVIFNIYTSNPGKNTNVQPFASFTARRNGSNPEDIVVSNDVYESIKDDYVYVRFSTTFLFWTTYYVAPVKLSDLMAGEVTLTFNQQ